MRDRDDRTQTLSGEQELALRRFCVALQRLDDLAGAVYPGDPQGRYLLRLANRCAYALYCACCDSGLTWLADELLTAHRNPAAARLLASVAVAQPA